MAHVYDKPTFTLRRKDAADIKASINDDIQAIDDYIALEPTATNNQKFNEIVKVDRRQKRILKLLRNLA